MKRKFFYTFLLILWMGVIFYFSADEAQESSEKSMEVCEGICDVFVVGYDELPRQEQLHRAEQLNFSVRKAAHFLEYTMLGILLVLALAQYPVQRRDLTAVGIGFLYAMTDEFHQLLSGETIPSVTTVPEKSFRNSLGWSAFLEACQSKRTIGCVVRMGRLR